MELPDDILEGKAPVAPVVTVKTHAEGVQITQKGRPNNGRIHETEVIAYCNRYNVLVVDTLQEAVDARLDANGKQKVISFREADCIFRQQVKLDSELLWATMFEFDVNCIYEELPPVKNGVYELRKRYNTGLQWMKKAIAEKAIPTEKIKEGEARLKQIAAGLRQLNFPMYKEEKINGFEMEYLKPEWMTWDKFRAVYKFPIYTEELTNPTEIPLATTTA